MNLFNRNSDREDYPLSAEEDARGAIDNVTKLLYVVLGAVVIITAAHAILLVVNTTGGFVVGDGLFGTILNAIRIAFPVVVELAAVAVCLGFVRSKWRGGQRGIGSSIEGAWFVFAGANMITFFALERGATLQGWQLAWVSWGLPLSALVISAMTYRMLKADPAHKRNNERALAAEKKASAEFNARQGVVMSDAMMTIHERRVWRDTVRDLAANGYDEDEIAFMTAHIPTLQELTDRPKPAAEPELKPGLIDRARAKLSNSTHNAARQESEQVFDTPHAQAARAAAGEGASLLTPDEVNAMIDAAVQAAIARATTAQPAPVAYANGREGNAGRPQ